MFTAQSCRIRSNMARQSVILLSGLARGKSLADMGVPEDGFLNIPARQIRSDNVDEFWAELKKNLSE